jgi:hypothetical protein
MSDNTITSAEVAEHLRKLAAAFDAMPPGPIPGGMISAEVSLYLHRYDGDTTTNGALMAYADQIANAAGSPPAELAAAVYRTPGTTDRMPFRVRAFLRTATPIVEIDPTI